jgi:hypothetical protein
MSTLKISVPPELKPKTPLSGAIYTRMKQQERSVKELAVDAGVHYETIRGIATGDKSPSKLLLREICYLLSLDFKTLNEMRILDQMQRKLGHLPNFTSKNLELQSIEELWPLLCTEDKEQVIHLVTRLAKGKPEKQKETIAPPRIAPRPIR